MVIIKNCVLLIETNGKKIRSLLMMAFDLSESALYQQRKKVTEKRHFMSLYTHLVHHALLLA